jgi:phage tail-like protein
MPDNRSFAAGSFALELDGAKIGFARSFRGGGAVAEVITEKLGPDRIARKHIGPPRYEDIEVQVGFGLKNELYGWIAASWEQKYARKDGAVVVADATGKALSRLEFFQALVTEVTVPKLDGASKDPAFLTVKLSPELVRTKKGDGKATGTIGKNEQKLFLPSNFRVTIDGLDCTKIATVDALTVKQHAATDDIGDARDMEREPAVTEFPNLKIALAANGADSWRTWFSDFVINGKNGQENEKSGKIELLSPNRQTVLATITLLGLGIYRLDDDWTGEAADKVRRVHAELYCEQMRYSIGVAKLAAPAPAERAISVADRVGSMIRR